MTRAAGGAAWCWVVLPALIAAQEPPPGTISVQVGLDRPTVTVGDPFTTAVRVEAPPGVRVEYGEFAAREDLVAIAPPEIGVDGGAFYRLVAWRADVPLEALLAVRLVDPGGEARIQLVRLRLPEVRSVLPAGDSTVAPRPAKGYVARPGEYAGLQWWYWLIALAGALLATLVGLHFLRRQERGDRVELGAREWAMRQIDRLAAELADGAAIDIHLEGTRILRGYLHRIDPELGTELTTTELLAEAPTHGVTASGLASLRWALEEADRIKFSGQVVPVDPSPWLAEIREWVSTWPEPRPSDPERRAA